MQLKLAANSTRLGIASLVKPVATSTPIPSALLPTVTRTAKTGTPSLVATKPGLAGASLAAAAPTFIVTVQQRMMLLLMMSTI